MKYLLLDGFNLVFRSFYGMPELTTASGFPTGAIHGWVRTIWALEDREQPDHIIAFFDLGGSKDRLAIHPEYKANRGETPEPIAQQIQPIKDLTEVMGIQVVEQHGVEADDLIGAAALKVAEAGHEAVIVSSDKDLAQILQNKIVQLLPPPTARPSLGWRVLDAEKVPEKFGVQPSQIVDYLSLIGDTSDNIPGIPGVGPKTAVKWIDKYENLEKIIASAGHIKPDRFRDIIPQHAEALMRNQKLIQLNTEYEVSLDKTPRIDLNKISELFTAWEMAKTNEQAKKRYEKAG